MKVSKTSLFVFFAVLLVSTNALAGTAAPWDSNLDKFFALFQGKIALGVFFVICFGAVAKIMEGGEMSDFVRKMLVGIIAVSAIAGIAALFNLIFGTAGYVLVEEKAVSVDTVLINGLLDTAKSVLGK